MEFTIDQQMEIESILEEASAWGLRTEVNDSAQTYIKSGHDVIDSYHYAYEDWIK